MLQFTYGPRNRLHRMAPRHPRLHHAQLRRRVGGPRHLRDVTLARLPRLPRQTPLLPLPPLPPGIGQRQHAL